jgi:hypothetical protein
MHYLLVEKLRLSFIDSDLLYRGAIKAGLTVIQNEGFVIVLFTISKIYFFKMYLV